MSLEDIVFRELSRTRKDKWTWFQGCEAPRGTDPQAGRAGVAGGGQGGRKRGSVFGGRRLGFGEVTKPRGGR